METVRIHVLLPKDLVEGIDALVGERGRSAFIAEVARNEVNRRTLLKLLNGPEPIWKSEDHPELKDGAASWVSKMRADEEAVREKRRKELSQESRAPRFSKAAKSQR